MYGLPHDFDTNVFLSRTLGLVCFAAFHITLHFDSDLEITIEGPHSYHPASEEHDSEFVTKPPDTRIDTKGLVGAVVVSAESSSDGRLSLLFNNGHRLTCYDLPGYESYTIHHGDRVIIV